jgi:multidrug efflux pump subunit AcrB
MHQIPSITHSRASIDGGEPKLWLNVDEAQADIVGLELRTIALQYEGSLEGFASGSVLEDIEELPVRVRLSDEQRSSIEKLSNLQLSTPNVTGWVPTAALAEVSLRPETASITRYNRERVNTIYGYLTPEAKAVSVARDIERRVREQITIPSGYSIDVAGDSEQQAEAVGNLLTYAPILAVMMIATLILAFRSVAMALIILSVAVFSVGLGMLSLKIAGYPLGFNPLIGSIGLTGVAINDTIVVLAAILGNHKARAGDVQEIVNETFGCARHVISTSLTTIGGFIPLLLFSGGSFWPPLSVVIAGGIGFALILAMFFTPLAYKIYADCPSMRAMDAGSNH